MALPWTDLPRFIGIVEPECDRPEHGYECRHLAGRDEEGNVTDEALDKLMEELEAAEDEVESAEDEIRSAEDRRDEAEREVDRIREEIKRHKSPVVPGQIAA